MTKRIFRAISLVALCVFLASLVLVMGLLYRHFSGTQKDQLQQQCYLAAQGIEGMGEAYFRQLDASACRITWIAADGSVLCDSQSPAADMENHADRQEVRQALETGIGRSSRYSSTLTEEMFYYALRLSDGTVVRTAIGQSSLFSLLWDLARPICLVAAVALILSLILANRLSKSIVKPLNQLDLDDPTATQVYEELQPLLERIDSQQHMRREFTGNVSHELKTPLHAISGYAELMAQGIARQEDMPRFASQIYDEAQRMIRLVEDILHLSQLDENDRKLQWEQADLYALAEQTVTSLTPAAQTAQVTLKLTGSETPIYTVPALAATIAHNLCDNAIKYNRPGGSVTLEVTRQGSCPVLRVTDTGIGIPPEYQSRIFERFYRVDKSRSKEVGGTGLGLSIVKHGALVLGAKLHLSSTPGEGTAITVTFPETE